MDSQPLTGLRRLPVRGKSTQPTDTSSNVRIPVAWLTLFLGENNAPVDYLLIGSCETKHHPLSTSQAGASHVRGFQVRPAGNFPGKIRGLWFRGLPAAFGAVLFLLLLFHYANVDVCDDGDSFWWGRRKERRRGGRGFGARSSRGVKEKPSKVSVLL